MSCETTLEGWGRFPRQACRVVAPRTESELVACVLSDGSAIARGFGRAYGDSAMSKTLTIETHRFNRMLSFSAHTGELEVESGVLLGDVISSFLPRGWFPAVTPGTKFVTIGGMVATDVHGKNHHKDGSFGNFVTWLDLVDSRGKIIRCSRRENVELFEWTIGGMGLTGIIIRVCFRLRAVSTGWIRQTLIPAKDLSSSMDIFESSRGSTYSVAWIDCLSGGATLGRSLVMLGEHADVSSLSALKREDIFAISRKRKLSIPFSAPTFTLNSFILRIFNSLYYWRGKRSLGDSLVSWDSYFYPLDSISHWNRIYGRRGFAQFQCVLPLAHSRAGLSELLRAVSNSGQGSFLAVLKRLGEESKSSRFSFAMSGYTLALDFPINSASLALLDRLDSITLAHGGRFYLAKDSRMTAETLRLSDTRSQEFAELRTRFKIRSCFASRQSTRLGL